MDYTVRGILQVRILEWVAFPFSRGSSQPRDWTQVSRIAGSRCLWRSGLWSTRVTYYWLEGKCLPEPQDSTPLMGRTVRLSLRQQYVQKAALEWRLVGVKAPITNNAEWDHFRSNTALMATDSSTRTTTFQVLRGVDVQRNTAAFAGPLLLCLHALTHTHTRTHGMWTV